MKNQKLILTLCLLSIGMLSVSCNSDKNSSSSTSVVTDASITDVNNEGKTTDSVNKTSAGSSAPSVSGEVNQDESRVTVINVTDSAGTAVTDPKGNPVTEVVLADNSNKPITDTFGNYIPPNISGSNANYKYGSLLWMADNHLDKNTNKHVFDVINTDGQIFAVQFKVNQNAAAGNYDISFQRKTSSGSGAFSTSEGTGIPTSYVSGTISVGADSAEPEKEFDSFTCYFTNAAAKPGDTVTVYGCVKNNNPGFSAFNTYFRYDSNVFTLEGIKAVGLLENTGEFISG